MQIGQGMEIAGFRLDELIGEGGMGVVYKARQLDLDRVVALKLIQPSLGDNHEFRARFQLESKLAASIDHPNIVPVFQAGDAGGTYFIAMRYVDGTDLGEYLRSRNSALEPGAAARLISEVAAGLDAAHEAGLVHRDVKPANILLDARLHPYLTDFGLTKQVTSQSLNTKTGLWIGSVNYSAPEQIEGEPVDARTDVYALGCVLFEALTRSLPYVRDNEMALMYAKVHNEPLLPSEVDPSLPREFDEVIRRALSRRPQDRFPSAGNLGAAALAAAQGVPDVAPERTVARGAASTTSASYEPTRATPVVEPATQVMRRRSSRNWLALAAGVLAVLAIVAISAVVVLSPGTDSGNAPAEARGKATNGAKNEAASTTTSSSPPEQTEPASASGAAAVEAVPLEPFRGRLYSAQVPAGWTAETIESHESTYYESQWRNPSDSNTSVLIDSQIHSASTTAIEDAEGVRSETSQSSGYRELAFEETVLQGQPAARWVFDVEADRRVDYFVISCGVGIAVLGSTSPADFGGWAPTFHAVANSVTPLCE
jgi:Protein kinase domain